MQIPEHNDKTHLSTKLKVNHHYGNLRDTAGKDHKYQEQETKQVVELVLPDGLKTDHKDALFKLKKNWKDDKYVP